VEPVLVWSVNEIERSSMTNPILNENVEAKKKIQLSYHIFAELWQFGISLGHKYIDMAFYLIIHTF
jgi:hypothetical protein